MGQLCEKRAYAGAVNDDKLSLDTEKMLFVNDAKVQPCVCMGSPVWQGCIESIEQAYSSSYCAAIRAISSCT